MKTNKKTIIFLIAIILVLSFFSFNTKTYAVGSCVSNDIYCSQFGSLGTCDPNRCNWFANPDGPDFCTDYCSKFRSQMSCQGQQFHGCQFLPTKGCTVKSSGNNLCEIYNNDFECNNSTKGCTWGEIDEINPPDIDDQVRNITNVVTGNATSVAETTAELKGSMNPGGLGQPRPAKAYFRYSTIEKFPPIFCNEIYGSNMRATNEVKLWGSTDMTVFTEAINLEPDTTYYYCLVGSNDSGQIEYGGVKSFRTKSLENVSVETKDATVVNEVSAYLKGVYNVARTAEIWFEYRLVEKPKNENTNITFGEKILELIKTKKVVAQVLTNVWKQKANVIKPAGSNDDLIYLLTGLAPGNTYQYRIAGRELTSSKVIYGETKYFTTKPAGGSRPGYDITGVGQIDPCQNTDDVDCNGTEPNTPPIGEPGTTNLPDLIVTSVSPMLAVVGQETEFLATVKNRGGIATSFTVPNQEVEEQGSGGGNEGGNSAFWKNIFKIKKAVAAITGGNNGNSINSIARGSFYNFFQISTINPSAYIDIPVQNENNNQNLSFWHKVFDTQKATAAENNGGTNFSSTLTNLSEIILGPLGRGRTAIISQKFTFNITGTYYMRACADKKNPADTGLIPEAYENNNCGAWQKITVINPPIPSTPPNPGGGGGGGGGNGGSSGGYNNGDLVLGEMATPPADAIVRNQEGIEHVFVRQIIKNTELAESFGYQIGTNLEKFAINLAHTLAINFGYIGTDGKEIRVIYPNTAAYELYMRDGVLTIYEYYNSVVVNIQKMTNSLRTKYGYEYYFKKIKNFIQGL